MMKLFKLRKPKATHESALYPMGGLTLTVACMHCKHGDEKYTEDFKISERCDLCMREEKNGFELGQCRGGCGNVTPPTPCRSCNHYHAYVNAKIGRGLCTHLMHEMPENGYCSEHGKGDKDE